MKAKIIPISDNRAEELFATGNFKIDVSVFASHSVWLVRVNPKIGPKEEYPISHQFAGLIDSAKNT